MKKIIIGIISILVLCGCGKINEENIVKEFSNKLEKSSSYQFSGEMQIISNEEKFDYKIDVSYLKDDYYKVAMLNLNNNHEQIILRNDDGVYVITPSLNKSFKFQSEWPYNSSQSYILKSLLNDLKNGKVEYNKENDQYILKTDVNYPNNNNLIYEKIYFDKDVNPIKTEVYDNNDNVAISVKFNKINYKARLEKKEFDIDNYIENDCCNKDNDEKCNSECLNNDGSQKSSSFENAIYPLYLPSNSSLTNSEVIETGDGNRMILTFSGDDNFVLVEEAIKGADEMEVIPVYGDPQILGSSVAALSANSLSWIDANVNFYLASNTLSSEEMLSIAGSLANSQVVSQSK